MTMSTTPLIYSELLSNIRQISVITALSTPSNASTTVSLLPNSQQFILTHEGKTTTLLLPGQVAPQAQLQKPAAGSKELSWRLPLVSQPPQSSDNSLSNEAPWSAASLSVDAQFSCRVCESVVLTRGTVREWKDLPSENWAEMMDFWHCHKPDIPYAYDTDAQSQPDKGYGPGSRFAATSGVGFVDLTSFLLSESDCTGLKPSSHIPQPQPQPQPKLSDTTSQPTQHPINCASCNHSLGYHDPQDSSIRLYKWCLKLTLTSSPTTSSLTTSQPPLNPSFAAIFSAQLLSIVHSQCVSRMILLPYSNPPQTSKPEQQAQQAEQQALSLWIFAPSLRYSSSSANKTNIHALKIFHQSLPLTSAAELLHSSSNKSASIEEMHVSSDTIGLLREVLKQSKDLLPASARRFGVWDVGLLGRWEEEVRSDD